MPRCSDTATTEIYTFNASANDVITEGIAEGGALPHLRALYNHIVNGNAYYSWPVVNNLFKPSFYFLGFVLLLIAALYRRDGRTWLLAAMPFFYLLTMLLGPTVNFRYIYPIAVVVPLLWGALASRVVPEGEDK